MAKLFIAIFVEKNRDEKLQAKYDEKKPYLDRGTAAALSVSCVLMLAIGLLPGIVADGIGEWCRRFFYVQRLSEKVAYFTFANLRGGLISLLIGAVLYAAVVRIFTVREDGSYTETWPKWWNTEKYLYKPLFLHILPSLFGFFCRIADSLTDETVLLLRKTVMKDEKLPFEVEEGTRLTYYVGGWLDRIAGILNRKEQDKEMQPANYRHRMAVKYEKIVEERFIIARSLSFGLLLFIVGLCFTLLYVLLD